MRDLPLFALRALASVYEHRGVRAAARELGVAHSSVSRHLAELTRRVGVPLVGSGAGRAGLTLTPQGEALARAALASLRSMEQAMTSLREVKSSRSVTISTAPSFATRWLLPRLPLFESAHPRIEISVVAEQKLVDPDGSNVDLAIRMGQGPWPDVICESFMDDWLYPVASPRFWKRTRRSARPEDLVGLRLLHDRDPRASWEAWRREHGPKSLDVRKGPRFASSDLVLRAAAQSQGVALARHRLAADDVASGALIRPMGERRVELGSSYWIVLPERPAIRAAITTVLAWLKAQAAV